MRAVHRPGAIFCVQPGFYVEPGGDQLIGHAQFFRVKPAKRTLVVRVLCLHPFGYLTDEAAWKRRIVELRDQVSWAMFWILHGICRRVEGAGRMAIDGDVIGMAVSSGFIECHHHLWAKLANNGHQFSYHLSSVSLCK